MIIRVLFLFMFAVIPLLQVVYTASALKKNRGAPSRQLLYANIATTGELAIFIASQTPLITDAGPIFIYSLAANALGFVALRRIIEYGGDALEKEDISLPYLTWSVALVLGLAAWTAYALLQLKNLS